MFSFIFACVAICANCACVSLYADASNADRTVSHGDAEEKALAAIVLGGVALVAAGLAVHFWGC